LNIIIDTHIFLWALADPLRINEKKRSLLEDPLNNIFVSAVSIAELMIKASINKLRVEYNPVDLAQKSGFELLPFSAEAALLLKNMPFHHKDPFDRMLIAQGIVSKYPIMTEDSKFSMYDCTVI
jgi:PIN domain nuclease of toxin-antitoxin system